MSRRAELWAGEGGEMTQTLYAHMNKRKKRGKQKKNAVSLYF
jgi:hypothetical protein